MREQPPRSCDTPAMESDHQEMPGKPQLCPFDTGPGLAAQSQQRRGGWGASPAAGAARGLNWSCVVQRDCGSSGRTAVGSEEEEGVIDPCQCLGADCRTASLLELLMSPQVLACQRSVHGSGGKYPFYCIRSSSVSLRCSEGEKISTGSHFQKLGSWPRPQSRGLSDSFL